MQVQIIVKFQSWTKDSIFQKKNIKKIIFLKMIIGIEKIILLRVL